MTARSSQNQRNTRGHRPRLQSISTSCNTLLKWSGMAHNHTSKGVHSNSSPKKQPAALLRQFQAVFLRPDILHSELQAWFRTHDHNRACGLTKPTQRMTMTAPKKNLIHAAIALTHFS